MKSINPHKIDLHIHSNISDGTNTPEEIAALVQAKGIELFSITDHDDVRGREIVRSVLTKESPSFLSGVEFSCQDSEGKYHILGYGYDPDQESIREVVQTGHSYRMKKVMARLDFLKDRFGFVFSEEDTAVLLNMYNPGKPHIANLMVSYGYAETKEEAIKEYINQIHFVDEFVRPEEAIKGILGAGGIPVLAHPSFGSGDELILGEEMDHRLRRLMEFGLKGVEAFYSGFTEKLRKEVLFFAEKYRLYVTAGSDYHGTNKLVQLGETGLDEVDEIPDGLTRFLNDTLR